MVFFFLSSRRRHTRCGRDWSSDVCSSDLLHLTSPQTSRGAGYPCRFSSGPMSWYAYLPVHLHEALSVKQITPPQPRRRVLDSSDASSSEPPLQPNEAPSTMKSPTECCGVFIPGRLRFDGPFGEASYRGPGTTPRFRERECSRAALSCRALIHASNRDGEQQGRCRAIPLPGPCIHNPDYASFTIEHGRPARPLQRESALDVDGKRLL